MLDKIISEYTVQGFSIDQIIQMLYIKKSELFKNPVFMKELLKMNLKYIIYDLSDDDSLYLAVIDGLSEDLKKKDMPEMVASFYDNKLARMRSEIINPQVVNDGYYKIPHKYLYEAMRKTFVSEKNIYDVMDSYFKYDGKRSIKFGETIERFYQDKTIDLYFAGVAPEHMDSIFREGYEINYGGDLSSNFWNAHNVSENFMSLLETTGHYRDGVVFAAVPKGDTHILGSDGQVGFYNKREPDRADYQYHTYLLPQYIVGYTQENNGEAIFIANNMHIDEQRKYANYGVADLSRYKFYDEILASETIDADVAAKKR